MHGHFLGSGKIGEPPSQEGKNAVASSVTVFTVASITFFIVRFLSRNLKGKPTETNTVLFLQQVDRHRYPTMMMLCLNRN